MRHGRLGAVAVVACAVLVSPVARAETLPAGFPWTSPSRRITSVVLRLPHGVDVHGVKALVPLRVGQELTRRALRRTVRLLYETLHFRQVRAHVRPEDGGVAVTFVLLPRQRIADIAFVGDTAMNDEALRRVSGLKRDDEYLQGSLERATDAIRTAYARIGYRSAQIEPEVRQGDDGVVACLFRITEGPRTRMAGVRFEGRAGLPEGELEQALGMEAGQPLDLSLADKALARIRARYRDAGYLRANVGTPTVKPAPGHPGGPWGWLVIPVQSGPTIRIRVTGNTLFTQAQIIQMLALPDDEPITLSSIEDRSARVVHRYRLAGHYRVRVTVSQRTLAPEAREIDLQIDEAEPLRVAAVRFPGAHVLRVGRLEREICNAVEAATPDPPLVIDPQAVEGLGGHRGDEQDGTVPSMAPPDPCTVYDPDAWHTALEAIADLYHNRGYLSVRVSAPHLVVAPGGRLAKAVVRIDEGVQTHIAEIDFRGTNALGQKKLDGVLPFSTGKALSFLEVEEGRFAVRRAYARAGYPFAKVKDGVAFDGTHHYARVDYTVSEGPQVHVGRIIVRGHHHTPASLVRSRLTFHQGDVWNLDQVRRSQQAILALGIYRSAVVRFLEPEDPAKVMDVVVVVGERRPQAVDLGLGVSTEDGPRAFVEYTNLLFLGYSELHARAKANYRIFPFGGGVDLPPGLEWETHLGLKFPMLLGSRTDLVWERSIRPVYSLTRLAGSVGTDLHFSRAVSASIKAEVEFDDLSDVKQNSGLVLTQQDRERLRLEEGKVLLASFLPGITVDLRDDPFSPHKGWLLTANLDWSKDLGIRVQPMHFIKATGSVARYQPLPGKVTLALSAAGGVIVPLRPDNHTIGPKRFFLGGADSLRGFPIDSVLPDDQRQALHQQFAFCEHVVDKSLCNADAYAVVVNGQRPTSAGGEAYVLFKGEVRFPIVGALQGGLFVDMGNLWQDPSKMNPFDLRTAAGAGLRYQTPVGPIALDLGINLAPDKLLNEEPYALHFAIGLF